MVCSRVCSANNNKENTKTLHYWSFVRGIHLWLVNVAQDSNPSNPIDQYWPYSGLILVPYNICWKSCKIIMVKQLSTHSAMSSMDLAAWCEIHQWHLLYWRKFSSKIWSKHVCWYFLSSHIKWSRVKNVLLQFKSTTNHWTSSRRVKCEQWRQVWTVAIFYFQNHFIFCLYLSD